MLVTIVLSAKISFSIILVPFNIAVISSSVVDATYVTSIIPEELLLFAGSVIIRTYPSAGAVWKLFKDQLTMVTG